jgi:hypothetical protein
MKKLALTIAFSAYVAVATSANALAVNSSDNYSGAGAIVDGRITFLGGNGFAPRY